MHMMTAVKLNQSKDYPAIKRTLWLVLLANIAITIVKISVGIITGALSVVADGFHSLVDSSSNLIGLAAIRLASRPADETHPYGYNRYETLGALAIGGLLLAAAWEIGSSVVDRIINGGSPELSLTSLILMLLTLPVNILIVFLETKAGKKYQSDILLADAVHTKTDLFVTTSVVISLVGIWLGWAWLDIVTASGVVILILKASFSILKNSASWLTDIEAVDPEEVDKIALSVSGVLYVHHIRSRGTPDAAFVDLHVKVAPEMSTSQAHAIASEVERQLIEKIPRIKDALVHIEPALQEPISPWDKISVELTQIAESMGLGYHDLHIHVDSQSNFIVELHLEIPRDITLRKAHDLADEFERRVKERWSRITNIITHLEPLSKTLLTPEINKDPETRIQIEKFLSEYSNDVKIIEITTNHLNGHFSIILRLGMDPELSLQDVHNRIEEIERQFYRQFSSLRRVIIHVEPIDYGGGAQVDVDSKQHF